MNSPEGEVAKQADLLRDQGDFDGAIAAYTEAIRLDPCGTEAYYARALVYGQKGEIEKAIADSTEAIRIDPKVL